MSLIRSEASASLHELHRHCVSAAASYRDGEHEGIPESAIALWETLATERREFASRLADELRHQGELPSAPDADRYDVATLAEHVRAEWARDEFEVVRGARLADEKHLQNLCRYALAQDLSASATALVRTLLQNAQAAGQRLKSVSS